MKKLILLLLFVPYLVAGQGLFIKNDTCYGSYKTCIKDSRNNYILTGVTTFLAGALNGVNQDIQFHYWEFQRTFPRANPQFWNPAISWKNKYEDWDNGIRVERFPFSSTALVFATDGKHLTDTSIRLLTTASIVFSYNRGKNWKHYLIDVAILTIVRNLGFHLTYSLIIK